MSINFATLRSVTIPEGNVIRIEKDGIILWSAGEIIRSRLMDRDGIYLMTSDGEYMTVLGEGNYEYEEEVIITSGNGFALYNGVKLPNIDSVWTDKEAYPYAAISYLSDADVYAYMIMLSSKPIYQVFYGDSSTFYISTADLSEQPCYVYSSDPILEEEVPGITKTWTYLHDAGINGDGVWTSADMYSGVYTINGFTPSDTLYLAASDPIPLDGMNVIEWDGDTTGVESLEDILSPYLFAVSDKYIDLEEGDDFVCVLKTDEGYVTYTQEDEFEYRKEEDDGEVFWALGSGAISAVLGYNVPSMDAVGTAFFNVEGLFYTSLFAYPATSTDSAYDVVFENDILYIKTAPASLNDTTLEVR